MYPQYVGGKLNLDVKQDILHIVFKRTDSPYVGGEANLAETKDLKLVEVLSGVLR